MKRLMIFLACLGMICGPAAVAQDFLKGKILRIDLDDAVAEKGGSGVSIGLGGISLSSSTSLLSLERAIRKAESDDRIAMIFLNLDHFSADMASLEETRQCLRSFSASGKPVVAYAASLDNSSFYLGSAADRLFLHPKADGALTGLGSTQYFLKDLLDKVGVEIQLIRHGKYKSAGEMYIRNDISPENREQYEELLGSIWGCFVEEMAESRNVSAADLRSWSDSLALGKAQTWIDKGLVDGLKYRDEMEDYLCRLFGSTDPGSVRTVEIEDYIDDLRKGPSSKKIAVIYADGEIVREGGDIVGEKLSRKIAAVRADPSVKAVVFRVNSPGGEVVAADMIRREIELLGKEKPVVASYGAYAASGGYLISAGCERIFTDNSTLTGSIGVFGLVPSIGNAVKKNLHVNLVQIGTGPHSGMRSGITPLTEEEEKWYQAQIEGVYDDFVGVVSDGRNMTREAVDSIAQGRVWSGKDALRIGLADERGTLLDAIDYISEKAGLNRYRIVCYPEKGSIMDSIIGRDKDDDHEPLVKLLKSLQPGLNSMALMPYMILGNPNPQK